MCDTNPGYTMLVGPEGELQELREYWRDVIGDIAHLDIPAPELHSLRDRGLGHVFDDKRCPAIGVIWHQDRLGGRLADLLQARMLGAAATSSSRLGANIMCESGFQLEPASSSSNLYGKGITLDPKRVRQADQGLTHGAGTSIAVVDTGGDSITSRQMVDFVGGDPLSATPSDAHGHGTAVAALIRALRPMASISPIRVGNNQGMVESKDLLLALTYVLWPGTFDVVNVSLTTQLAGHCATGLGRTLTYVLELCRRQGRAGRTSIVAAAGNKTSGQTLGYPALLPGVEVAVGLDWSGRPASYNVDTSRFQGRVQAAFGGTQAEPFGTMNVAGASRPIWGTSFSAAVVSASHLA